MKTREQLIFGYGLADDVGHVDGRRAPLVGAVAKGSGRCTGPPHNARSANDIEKADNAHRQGDVMRSYRQIEGASDGLSPNRIGARVVAPSLPGDMVLFTLIVLKVGLSSVTVRITATAGTQTRLRVTLTRVLIDGMKAATWPAEIRHRLERHLEGTP
jgi:hypothetical protein